MEGYDPRILAVGNAMGVDLTKAPVIAGDNNTLAPTPVAPHQSFLGSIGHTIGSIPGVIQHGVAAVGSALNHVGQGVVQGAPVIGTNNSQIHALNAARAQQEKQDAVMAASYKAGKISKKAYNSYLRSSTKGYSDLSAQSKDLQGQMVSPEQFLSGAAMIPALIASGGALTATAGGEGVGGAVEGFLGARGAQGVSEAADAAGVAQKAVGAGKALAKAPVKAALNNVVAQSAVQAGQDAYHGDYAGAAGNVAMLAAPVAAVKAGEKYGPGIVKGASDAIFTKGGAEIGKIKFSDGNVHDFLDALKAKADAGGPGAKTAAKDYQKYNNAAKVSEDLFQQDGRKAGDIKNYVESELNKPTSEMTTKEFLDHQINYQRAEKAADLAHRKGIVDFGTDNGAIPKGYRVGAVRFDARKVQALTERLTQAASPEERLSIVKEGLASGDIPKNPHVEGRLMRAVNAETPEEVKAEMKGFKSVLSAPLVGPKPRGLGEYSVGLKKTSYGKFRSPADVADLAKAKEAPLHFVGDALRRSGLSPEGGDVQAVSSALKANLRSELKGTRFETQSDSVFGRMYALLHEGKGVYDPRLLSLSKIRDGLGVTDSEAKVIRKAFDNAYLKTPLGARALGEKLTDFLVGKMNVGPIGFRNFLKVQGYGRFSANPIFWVKRDLKTELVGQAEVGGKAFNLGKSLNRIMGTAPSDDTMKLLANHGKFSRGSLAGDTADLLGNMMPASVASNLDKNAIPMYMRQTMGQVAEKFAQIHGTTVKALLEDNGPLGEQFDHILDLTTGYGKSGYLTSNFAKTLNVFIFPSRFDTKVAMAVGKWYTQQPPVVQAALAKGLLNLTQFADSPDGKQWAKDNYAALEILKYFTPTETFQQVFDALRIHGQVGVTDIGAVGGMPLGFVTTILHHQGIDMGPLNPSPYHDPATGNIVPDKIPVTDKARAQTALADLIGSMYSFPGKQLGLPISKTDVTNTISLGATKTAKGSTKSVVPAGATPTPKIPADTQPPANYDFIAPFKPTNTPVVMPGAVDKLSEAAKKKSAKTARVKTVPSSLQIKRP